MSEESINAIIQEIDKLNALPNIEETNFNNGYKKALYDSCYLYQSLIKEIEKLREENDIAKEKVKSATKEIERLNNIINELEESLKDDKEEYSKDLDIETKELYNEYWRGYSVCADKNLEYLQELKGNINEKD